MNFILPNVLILAIVLSARGTTTPDRAFSGAGIGAATGAVGGALMGNPAAGAVIGAAAGAATGALTHEDTINLGKPWWR